MKIAVHMFCGRLLLSRHFDLDLPDDIRYAGGVRTLTAPKPCQATTAVVNDGISYIQPQKKQHIKVHREAQTVGLFVLNRKEKDLMNDQATSRNGSQQERKKPRFPLGQVVATPGALEALEAAGDNAADYLNRHVCGDWGDLEEEDKQENELSAEKGFRILSAYHLSDGTKIWIITEADRSVTTLLLPEEY